MNNSDYILLYIPEDKTQNVTVGLYERWRAGQRQQEIAEFVYQRLYRRYMKPFEFSDIDYRTNYKNGFSLMANDCLLIETLESFYRGWDKSSSSELAFLKFFTRDERFAAFSTNDIPTKFYRHIRCGILHQGETTGGWKINRSASSPLLEINKREINAHRFSATLKLSLGDYRDLLRASGWKSPLWESLKKKMKAILKNCEFS